jgi:hypothetical protein
MSAILRRNRPPGGPAHILERNGVGLLLIGGVDWRRAGHAGKAPTQIHRWMTRLGIDPKAFRSSGGARAARRQLCAARSRHGAM